MNESSDPAKELGIRDLKNVEEYDSFIKLNEIKSTTEEESPENEDNGNGKYPAEVTKPTTS